MEMSMTTFSTLVAAATSSLAMASFAPCRASGDLRQRSEMQKLSRKYVYERISARFILARLCN
ncbi:hypothetical protein CO656_29220 [Sinorhizobium sp. FG01]|uniref:Secreted protein n=2 Tax=Sinorhizobium americanum TaxID=194963 RepID=A0A2S3YLL4_9HYPH|nr:hypothetical protein CO656_29220 [Sinorhizobium sp. FG01]POH29768.1 hypothetical protein ATY31_17750 [Sinorhizobium americanum]